jgi:hypothetical protein
MVSPPVIGVQVPGLQDWIMRGTFWNVELRDLSLILFLSKQVEGLWNWKR